MLKFLRKMEILQLEYLDIKEDQKYKELISRVVKKCFEEENIEKLNLYISITLTTPEQIKILNKKYRNIDKETDVLSFPMYEKQEIDNMKENKLKNPIQEVLGDIVISIKKVEEQAIEYNHSFERELSYMVVHGFYHLMGYDHIDENDKIIMRKKEENILNNLNIVRN